MQPVLEVEQLRLGLATAGELQDVFDHQVHAFGVVLNDLRQALIRAVQILRFLQ